MSSHLKTIVLLVILIAVVIIGWLWYAMSNGTPVQAPASQNSPSADNYAATDAGLTTSASDSSDAALQSDLNSVGTQMNSSNADTANIDQSLKN
ncbi:MAG TPA: hypothetical protein VL335_00845 [Candidatus Paceibacterota bacterium]|jgi:hypothetical protein|nr:hypothetical protein [Candidatus Paceibacterota bacterium]